MNAPKRYQGLAVTESASEEVDYYSQLIRSATKHRDEAIRRMLDEGYSLRAIAEFAGLTHTAIAKIRDR